MFQMKKLAETKDDHNVKSIFVQKKKNGQKRTKKMFLVSSYLNVLFLYGTCCCHNYCEGKFLSRKFHHCAIYLLLILRFRKREKMLHKKLHVKCININKNKNILMWVYRDVTYVQKVRILKGNVTEISYIYIFGIDLCFFCFHLTYFDILIRIYILTLSMDVICMVCTH